MILKNLSISNSAIIVDEIQNSETITGTITVTTAELNKSDEIWVALISKKTQTSIIQQTINTQTGKISYDFELEINYGTIVGRLGLFPTSLIFGDSFDLVVEAYKDWAPVEEMFIEQQDIVRIINSRDFIFSKNIFSRHEKNDINYSIEEVYGELPYSVSLKVQYLQPSSSVYEEVDANQTFILFPDSFFKLIIYKNNEENIFFSANFNQNEQIIFPTLVFPENENFILKFSGQITFSETIQILIEKSFSFQTKNNPGILFNFSLSRQDYDKNNKLFSANYGEKIKCFFELNIPEINFPNKFSEISIKIYEEGVLGAKILSISQDFISPKLYSFERLLEGNYSKDNSYGFYLVINNGFYEEIKKITIPAFLEPTLRIEKNSIGLWKNLPNNGFNTISDWTTGDSNWFSKGDILSYKGNYYQKITNSQTTLNPLEDNINFKLVSSENIPSTFYSNAQLNYFSNYLQFNQTNYWSEREISWNILNSEIEIDSNQEPLSVRMNLEGEVTLEGTIKIGGSSSERIIGYLPNLCCPIYSKNFIISVGPYNTNYTLSAKIRIEPSGEIILVRIFNGVNNYTNATKVNLYFNIKYTTGSLFYIPAKDINYDEFVGQKIFGVFDRIYTSNNPNFFYASSEQPSFELFTAFTNGVFWSEYEGWKNVPEDTNPYIVINGFSQNNSSFSFSKLFLSISEESLSKISSINIYTFSNNGLGYGNFLKTFTNLEEIDNDFGDLSLIYENDTIFYRNEKIKIEFIKKQPSDVINVTSIAIENPYRVCILHRNPFSPIPPGDDTEYWNTQEQIF